MTGKLILKSVPFENDIINLYLVKYVEGNTYGLRSTCFDTKMGIEEPYMSHTVNFPGILEKDEIAVKEYNEGVGSLAFLFSWDIIGHPHKYIDSEFIKNIPVCRLLINPDSTVIREGENILE